MKFHYLARGIVWAEGRVLLAHQKGADNTFLPGGHIDAGERAEAALIREIEEEIGRTAAIERFVGALEADWEENGALNHEINLLFEVSIPNLDPATPPVSLESHLEFFWAAPHELATRNLLPSPLIACLTNWNPERPFWGSAMRAADELPGPSGSPRKVKHRRDSC